VIQALMASDAGIDALALECLHFVYPSHKNVCSIITEFFRYKYDRSRNRMLPAWGTTFCFEAL
jgi:hypothetical protein